MKVELTCNLESDGSRRRSCLSTDRVRHDATILAHVAASHGMDLQVATWKHEVALCKETNTVLLEFISGKN